MKKFLSFLLLFCFLFGVCSFIYSEDKVYKDRRLERENKSLEIRKDFDVYRYDLNTNSFVFRMDNTKKIFFLTMFMVILGLIFSIFNFILSFINNYQNNFEKDEIKFSIFGKFKIRIKTAHIGLIVLLISFAFLYLYMKNIYPITYLPGHTKVNDTADIYYELKDKGNDKLLDDLDERIFKYFEFSYEYNKDLFNWNSFSTKFMFYLTIILVWLGVVLSFAHFIISFIIGRKAEKNNKSTQDKDQNNKDELALSMDKIAEIKIRTNSVGIILLIISIVFLWLYMVDAYPLRYLNKDHELIKFERLSK